MAMNILVDVSSTPESCTSSAIGSYATPLPRDLFEERRLAPNVGAQPTIQH